MGCLVSLGEGPNQFPGETCFLGRGRVVMVAVVVATRGKVIDMMILEFGVILFSVVAM